MLINASSASGGELIAHDFRARNLGPLIGSRTAGSAFGTITFDVLDGGQISIPYNAPMSGSRRIVEGVGVVPDFAVSPDPMGVTDPQLDAGVRVLLQALQNGALKK